MLSRLPIIGMFDNSGGIEGIGVESPCAFRTLFPISDINPNPKLLLLYGFKYSPLPLCLYFNASPHPHEGHSQTPNKDLLLYLNGDDSRLIASPNPEPDLDLDNSASTD